MVCAMTKTEKILSLAVLIVATGCQTNGAIQMFTPNISYANNNGSGQISKEMVECANNLAATKQINSVRDAIKKIDRFGAELPFGARQVASTESKTFEDIAEVSFEKSSPCDDIIKPALVIANKENFQKAPVLINGPNKLENNTDFLTDSVRSSNSSLNNAQQIVLVNYTNNAAHARMQNNDQQAINQTWLTDIEKGCSFIITNPQYGETIRWDGDCKDGYGHGSGTVTHYISGQISKQLRAFYVYGVVNGNGRLIFSNGTYYEGEFENSVGHGFGRQSFADGRVCDGQVIRGSMNGNANCTFNNGDRYSGKIMSGTLTGNGKYIWADGTSYDGDFVNGVQEGKGELIFNNGIYYVGGFHNNNFSGLGDLVYPNGQHYKVINGKISNGDTNDIDHDQHGSEITPDSLKALERIERFG